MASEPITVAEASSGMPQLDFTSYPNQIFWLLITLVAIYLILKRVAVPRIAGILSTRANQIQRDLDAALAMKNEAEEAEHALQQTLEAAKAEANDIISATKAELAGELREATEKADEVIAEKAAQAESQILEIREGAKADVKDIALNIVADITGKILPKAGDARSIKSAVETRMKG